MVKIARRKVRKRPAASSLEAPNPRLGSIESQHLEDIFLGDHRIAMRPASRQKWGAIVNRWHVVLDGKPV